MYYCWGTTTLGLYYAQISHLILNKFTDNYNMRIYLAYYDLI